MKFLSTSLSVLLIAVLPLQAEMPGAISAVESSVPSTGTGSTPSPGQTNSLQIRLADAGNAVVEANSMLKGFSIAVTDSAGLPVSEVAVAIRLPEDGASGFFADGAHSAVAYTNASGVATFPQVNWGATLGLAAIRVTAVKGELHAGAIIEQTIVAHSAGMATGKAQATVISPAKTAVPGTPASVAAVHGSAKPDQSTSRTADTATSPEPVVSVSNTGGAGTHSNRKWILLGVVAAGAGVGAALALGGHGSTPAVGGVAGLTIGTPTITVGH